MDRYPDPLDVEGALAELTFGIPLFSCQPGPLEGADWIWFDAFHPSVKDAQELTEHLD